MSNNVYTKPLTGLLVFTDLDGTLLDYDDYGFDEAQPAIQLLQEQHVPIIPTTSKTVEEMLIINQALNNRHPFIAENGSIICVPNGYFEYQSSTEEYASYQVIKLALEYSEIIKILLSIRNSEKFSFIGFNDMTVEVIAKETGLTIAQARNAKNRVCSEPIMWQSGEDELIQFKSLLEGKGLQLVKGGRFWHVLGNANKAIAMRELISMYQAGGLNEITSIALGDSPNDIDMLKEADIAIVIRGKNGTQLHYESNNKTIYSSKPGPAGWNETILTALTNIENKSEL